jgi:hypothetical protein
MGKAADMLKKLEATAELFLSAFAEDHGPAHG